MKNWTNFSTGPGHTFNQPRAAYLTKVAKIVVEVMQNLLQFWGRTMLGVWGCALAPQRGSPPSRPLLPDHTDLFTTSSEVSNTPTSFPIGISTLLILRRHKRYLHRWKAEGLSSSSYLDALEKLFASLWSRMHVYDAGLGNIRLVFHHIVFMFEYIVRV